MEQATTISKVTLFLLVLSTAALLQGCSIMSALSDPDAYTAAHSADQGPGESDLAREMGMKMDAAPTRPSRPPAAERYRMPASETSDVSARNSYGRGNNDEQGYVAENTADSGDDYRRPSTSRYSRYMSYNKRDRASMRGDVAIGMSRNQVRSSWGEPSVVQVAGDPRYENERWVYNDGRFNRGRLVYFENGKVAGWENF